MSATPIERAERAWAASSPSRTGGYESMSPHSQHLLRHRIQAALTAALDRDELARVLFLSDRGSTLRPGFAARQWDGGHVGEVREAYLRQVDALIEFLLGGAS